VGHEPALGFLGDSALLIMVVFFAVAGLVVLRGLRQEAGSGTDSSERDDAQPDR
jgi:hypothetical protein